MAKYWDKIERYLIIFSPFIILGVYKICSIFNIKTICFWKLLTGHNCLGCGITRAIVFMLKGQFDMAIKMNWRVVIVLPVLLYVWIMYIMKNYKYLKGEVK